MSDGGQIDYKEYFKSVAKRTRAQRKAVYDDLFGDDEISSTSRRDVEAAPANGDSGAVPAEIPPNTQRKKVQSRGFSSSRYNNVVIDDLKEVPARKRRRPKGSFGRRKKGNTSAAMDMGGIKAIDEAEFYGSNKRRMASNMEERPSEGSRAASRRKNVEGVGHGSDQELPFQKGEGNEDMDSEDIDRIVDEVFINLTTGEVNPDVSPRKDVSNESKKVFSADYRESFYSKDASNGTNHELPHETSSFLPRGGSGEYTIEEIDEAEFRNQTRYPKSKIGRSLEQGSDSNPSANKGNPDQLKSCRKSKFNEINLAEFRNGKSRTSSRSGSSARPLSSAANSRQNADIMEELPAENCRGCFTSEGPCRGSDKGQTDKSRSFTEKGNNVENMDLDDLEIIDKSDFMKRTHFVTKVRSSTLQGPDGEHIASSSRKNVKSVSKNKSSNGKGCRNEKKRGVSSKSRRMRKDGSRSKNLNCDNDSSDDIISSYSSTKFISENNTSLPYDVICLDGAEHETDLGEAAQTMSKMTKEPEEFSNLRLSLNPDLFGAEELCKNDRACDAVNYIPIEVSASKGEDCRQKGSVEKRAPNRRHQNPQYIEPNCELLTPQKWKIPSTKRRLSNEASPKQAKGRIKHKKCEIHEENGERNRIYGNDSKAEDELNVKSTLPNSTCPKQSYVQNNCDEAKGVNGLHPKDQSQTGIMLQKNEASSSHLKDDHIYIDDDDDDDNDDDDEEEEEEEGEDDGDEEEEPTRKQQVFSEQYDFCDRVADSVLNNWSVFETEGNVVEAIQAPPSQTESTLPLKFRFEDEIPKEVEKTEHEKELEGLFSELDNLWAFRELESSNYVDADEEDENPSAEETHLDRCNKGKHELILIDDEGLICIYCQFVALEPKDIIPDLVEITRKRRKKNREAEQPECDELHFQPGKDVNNAADCGNSGDGTVWSLKAGIRESMYEHQREGFEFLWKNLAGSIHLEELKSPDPREVGGCIISHAPGTGKTRLTINFIETYLRMFPNCMPVIISPASMLLTWEEEFRKWNVGFPFLNLNNPESVSQEMQAALKQIRGVNRRNQDARRMLKIWLWSRGRRILGISYSLFEKLTGEKYLKGKKNNGKRPLDIKNNKMRTILLEKPGLVVLDEGHTPRNQRSNIWNALLKLATDKRVILSGTPFQNNLGELFNTLHLVRPAIADVLTRERTFAEMSVTRRGNKIQYSHSQSSLDKLKLIMAPFVHVHKGTILQQSLPGLRDCVVLLKPSALQKSIIERVAGPSTFEYEHRIALISVHPYLLLHPDLPDKLRIGMDMAAIEASKMNPDEGVKIKFILELVRLSLVLKEKVLIFSQFIQPLGLIKDHLKECFKWAVGKEILRMDGRMEQRQRQVLINTFNDPKNESKVMLGSTKCCSEGISLIGASRVILLDVVWNPSVERQAISRAYRIGQKKFVYTYHLMTSGTTEAEKYCKQTEKERLSELVFTSSSNESKNQEQPALSIEDRVLEEMVGNERLKGMFDKIINQPKETDLIQTFGLT